MIIRILGEGQYDVAESEVPGLNTLDDTLEQAVEQGDEAAFTEALAGLLAAVKVAGSRLSDDSLQDSDLILPPADASIDGFVEARLRENGLTMSPQTDARTLTRRLHFDIIGLPPSDVSDASDLSGKNYETLVDSLLASPHFG